MDRGGEDEVDRGEEDEGDYEGGEDDMSTGFSFCFRLSASVREILSIQMFYDLNQKWIGIALCCGGSQYACG